MTVDLIHNLVDSKMVRKVIFKDVNNGKNNIQNTYQILRLRIPE